ncbi:PREDICTED: uncharacterized protein At2g39795, mitochondrial-like [Tarenaya hassleriana]|uniref:uncharacterized protein At2g39795, mitochondrial-like n=1 Tax=Tarenaya hassleriana TaxID=28532 RepID=UPI00053C99B1|nr:PREDICTED: uncharacterized protein At2g39795, mitochondrial-like [Tarenaya hassleriana]
MFRRASSTAAALAFRAVRSPARFGAAVSVERLVLGSQLSRGSASSFARFSTDVAHKKSSSDENLIRVIDSEIECAKTEEAPDHNVMEEKPEGFPFEIVDTPGERTVLLKRNFEDETIQVEVDTLASYEDEGGDEGGDEEEDGDKTRVPMVLSVSKGDGLCLEFGVSAYPDEIVIDSLSIKRPQDSDEQLAYEGPDFEDLDENLQKAFLKFLEVRGIKASTTNFLIEYMANKDSREYLQWLKDLKSFVQK